MSFIYILRNLKIQKKKLPSLTSLLSKNKLHDYSIYKKSTNILYNLEKTMIIINNEK